MDFELPILVQCIVFLPIIIEDLRKKLGLLVLKPTPYTFKMVTHKPN